MATGVEGSNVLDSKSKYLVPINDDHYIIVDEKGEVLPNSKSAVKKQVSLIHSSPALVDSKLDSNLAIPSLKRMAPRMLGKRRGRDLGVSIPPRLLTTLGHVKTFRFSPQNSSSRAITVADVLGAAGVIGTVVNTTAVTLHSSVKIHRVTVWPGAGGSGAQSTASVSWAAGESSQVPDEAYDDSIPQGTTVTNALAFTPPKGSLAQLWITSADSAAVLFNISAPAGAIVDVQLSLRVCDTIQPLAVSVATAALGHIYYLSLDGPSGNVYPPTSLPTTH